MRDARQLVECRNPDCRAFGMLTAHALTPAKGGTGVVAVCAQCGRENPRPKVARRGRRGGKAAARGCRSRPGTDAPIMGNASRRAGAGIPCRSPGLRGRRPANLPSRLTVVCHMVRVASIVVLIVSALGSGGCNPNPPNCGSGPCRTNVQWGPNEIAADLYTELFPPHVDIRDHLYQIRCRITHGGSGASCVGRRRFGPHPRRLVSARALLRSNGSWDLICWPRPSSLCDSVQIREQRRDPYTIPAG
jgi:hypothetical protein